MGTRPGRSMLVEILVSTPFIIATINAVLAGAIGGLVVSALGTGVGPAVGVAAVVGVGMLILEMIGARRAIESEIASLTPKFPAPAPASPPAVDEPAPRVISPEGRRSGA